MPACALLLPALLALAPPPAGAATPARQPEPPPGRMSARLRWLEQNAPLSLPDRGCVWLPAAPGCDRAAWACVAPWSAYGSGGGTYGATLLVGEDPEVFAALSSRDLTDVFPARDRDPDPNPDEAGRDGTRFPLLSGVEAFPTSFYDSCMQPFNDRTDGQCDAACRARFDAGDLGARPGWAEEDARCGDEAVAAVRAINHEERCTLILVDACTGHLGVRCPDRTPAYSTPAYAPWSVAP